MARFNEPVHPVDELEDLHVTMPYSMIEPVREMLDAGFQSDLDAHDEPDAYAAGEDYFPDELEPLALYQPVPRGLELKIGEKLKHLAARDRASLLQRRKP